MSDRPAGGRRLGQGRLHFQQGPIDLVLKAEGPGHDVAERAAAAAFDGLLARLVEELPALRRPLAPPPPDMAGPVARRMVAAVLPFADRFVTPMAAVAGAVADHVLDAMTTAAPDLTRAWVNDGGDIAFHLGPGARFEVGLVPVLHAPSLSGKAAVGHADPARGVATSGWRGRSFSLGIADAVTVLARDAATADVAATLIANAVDLPGHPAVRRVPARTEDPDSDLADRLVTRAVEPLSAADRERALDSGAQRAREILDRKLILGVILWLQGRWRVVGHLCEPLVTASPSNKQVFE